MAFRISLECELGFFQIYRYPTDTFAEIACRYHTLESFILYHVTTILLVAIRAALTKALRGERGYTMRKTRYTLHC